MVEKNAARHLPAPDNDLLLTEEILAGVPNREVLAKLDEEDRVMLTAFGLNRNGVKPFYPSFDSVVEAVYRDYLKGGTRVEKRDKFFVARSMYEEEINGIIGALTNLKTNVGEINDEQRSKAGKVLKFLHEQGYKDDIPYSTLQSIALRRAKPGEIFAVVNPKPKPQTDKLDLSSGGWRVYSEEERNKYHNWRE